MNHHIIRSRIAACLLFLTACVSPHLAPMNTMEPGWRIQHGQAVWRPPSQKVEIAGDLEIATHPDGRKLITFTKTPFPIAVLQMSPKGWHISFPSEQKEFGAPGKPSTRLVWGELALCLDKIKPRDGWQFERTGQQFRLENRKTAELLEGYLDP
jgi:hypothetical protein